MPPPPPSHLNPKPTLHPVSYNHAELRKLDRALVDGLKRELRGDGGDAGEGEGELWEYGSEQFRVHATVFNGTIESKALVLVRPTTTKQISRLIVFARTNSLEISVKGGGYGTHGWSVAGQVIIDLSLMCQISVDLPSPFLPALKNTPIHPRNGHTNVDLPKGKGKFQGNGTGVTEGEPTVGKEGKGRKRSAAEASWNDTIQGESSSSNRGFRRPNPMLNNGTSSSSEQEEVMTFGRPDGVSSSESASDSRHRSASGNDNSNNNNDRATGSGSSSDLPNEKGDEARRRQKMIDGLGSTSGMMLGNGYGGISYAGSAGIQSMSSTSFGSAGLGGPSPFGGISSLFSPGSTPKHQFGSTPSSSSHVSQMSDHLHLAALPHRDSRPPHILVTFGAGATSKQLDRFSAASPWGPYFVPFAAFPVGTAVMMTGGFGFLSRAYGLSMDNLIELEMVLSDGRIAWISELDKEGNAKGKIEWPDGKEEDMDPEEAKEMWWGVRGAGTALGIATRYRAKAFHVPVVFAGNLIYPFNPTTTPNLMRHVRDCVKGSSRNLYANFILTAGPNSTTGVVIIQLCYIGNRNAGAEYLTAISAWDEERCLFKDVEERDFLQQQDSIANVLKGGAGRKWFIKSDLLESLTDEIVWKTCQQFGTVPDGCTWLFELTTGAMADCKTTCLPQSHREASYTVAALHQWPIDMPEEDPRCVRTASDWIRDVIHTKSPGGPLPCFAQSSHPDEIKGVYGVNYDRLVRLKQRVDPTNLFKHCLWPSLDNRHNTPLEILYAAGGSGSSSERQQIWAEEDLKLSAEGIAGLYNRGEDGLPILTKTDKEGAGEGEEDKAMVNGGDEIREITKASKNEEDDTSDGLNARP